MGGTRASAPDAQSAEPRTRSEPAREQPEPAIATLKDKFSGGGCTR